MIHQVLADRKVDPLAFGDHAAAVGAGGVYDGQLVLGADSTYSISIIPNKGGSVLLNRILGVPKAPAERTTFAPAVTFKVPW